MEIKPGIGIGDIKLGMTQSQIQGIVGKPDNIKVDSEDSDRVYLEFNKFNLRLTIYKDEQNRLGYLSTTHSDTNYLGKEIIGKEIRFVQENIFHDLVSIWDIEEYDFWKTYGDYQYWITLNVEFNKVKGVELGVIIDDKNDYKWPPMQDGA